MMAGLKSRPFKTRSSSEAFFSHQSCSRLVFPVYSPRRPAGRDLILSAEVLHRNEFAMHDLIIASSLVAMLIVPCFAAMKQDVTSDESE